MKLERIALKRRVSFVGDVVRWLQASKICSLSISA